MLGGGREGARLLRVQATSHLGSQLGSKWTKCCLTRQNLHTCCNSLHSSGSNIFVPCQFDHGYYHPHIASTWSSWPPSQSLPLSSSLLCLSSTRGLDPHNQCESILLVTSADLYEHTTSSIRNHCNCSTTNEKLFQCWTLMRLSLTLGAAHINIFSQTLKKPGQTMSDIGTQIFETIYLKNLVLQLTWTWFFISYI